MNELKKFPFIMLIGPSGSGKSTFAEKLATQVGHVIVSSDRIREELYGDASIQENPQKVFQIAHERIIALLVAGYYVVFDATNMTSKYRKTLMEKIPKGIKTLALIFLEEFYTCSDRQEKRERKVPDEVIYHQIKTFEIPMFYEGFDRIAFYPPARSYNFDVIECKMDTFEQDNHNHQYTVGRHSRLAVKYLEEKGITDKALLTATRFHDMGKLWTKFFKNTKGEPTYEAHYYSHHNVGAYYFCLISFSLTKDWNKDEAEIIETATLINYHMQPYFCKTEKSKKRWEERLGSEIWNKILLLHEADEAAH